MAIGGAVAAYRGIDVCRRAGAAVGLAGRRRPSGDELEHVTVAREAELSADLARLLVQGEPCGAGRVGRQHDNPVCRSDPDPRDLVAFSFVAGSGGESNDAPECPRRESPGSGSRR